jgi:heme/copper-type cytochrome/quinol oxidase subunit 4
MGASVLAAVFGISVAFLGPIARNFFRTVFSIPALLLAPLSFGFSFMLLGQGLGLAQTQHEILTLLAEGLLSFSALVLVALWLFPATRADGTENKSKVWTRLVLAIFLALAAFATGLQGFALSTTVNYIAGVSAAQSLAVRTMTLTYMFNERGTAQLGAILFVLLALLGVIASIVLVATNFRLDLHRFVSVRKSAGWWLGLVLGLCVLVVTAAISATFFTGFLVYSAKFANSSLVPPSAAGPNEFGSLISSVGNMVVPVLAWVCVSSLLTYLAAFGIGALRPLGRYSEWLMLPFFPYFFVSVVILSPVFLDALTKLKLYDTPASLLYPLLIFVPQLIFLTLFFKGQVYSRARANPRPTFARAVLLPSIPVALTFAVVSALLTVRDSYWYMIAISKIKTLPVLYFEGFETYNLYSLCYYPLAASIGSLLLLFPIIALLQIFVVDRLRIQVGHSKM